MGFPIDRKTFVEAQALGAIYLRNGKWMVRLWVGTWATAKSIGQARNIATFGK